MTHFIDTRIGRLEVLAEYPEKQPTPDGGCTSVMMVQVRDSKGQVTIMPRSNLDVISRIPAGEGHGGTGPADLEWTPDLGLMTKGAKDLHFAPGSVGDLYQKKRKRGTGGERI